MTILCAMIKFIGKLLLGIAYAILKVVSFSVKVIGCMLSLIHIDVYKRQLPNRSMYPAQARSHAAKNAAVLRLHRTQSKDRRF